MSANNSDSDSGTYSIKQEKDTKQVKIKMAAKRQPKCSGFTQTLDQSHSKVQTPVTTPKSRYHLSHSVAKTHLLISFTVSATIIMQAMYWEWSARAMDGFHHKWAHLQVSIAFSIFNLLPFLAVFYNMYSPMVSIAVLLNAVWVIYHIFGLWIYDICAYNSFSEMCIAVRMYKNITLCLLAIVICHNWLLLLTVVRTRESNTKIAEALDKAEHLDLEDEDIHSIESTEMFGDGDDNAGMADIDLQTPMETDPTEPELVIDIQELQSRFAYFNSHLHTGTDCAHCSWEDQNTTNNETETETDLELGLRVNVPQICTKRHAIVIV